MILPIGSMYAIYGNIYHQYTPNVAIYGNDCINMTHNIYLGKLQLFTNLN